MHAAQNGPSWDAGWRALRRNSLRSRASQATPMNSGSACRGARAQRRVTLCAHPRRTAPRRPRVLQARACRHPRLCCGRLDAGPPSHACVFRHRAPPAVWRACSLPGGATDLCAPSEPAPGARCTHTHLAHRHDRGRVQRGVGPGPAAARLARPERQVDLLEREAHLRPRARLLTSLYHLLLARVQEGARWHAGPCMAQPALGCAG